MINPEYIIENITKQLKIYFVDSILTFNKDRYAYKYYSVSNSPSEAQSRGTTIMVSKWLETFWVYIEIEFRRHENLNDYFIFFSLSVFKGEDTDPLKTPLFRAEWDNYEDNKDHPQPHWHFYERSGFQKNIDQFSDMLTDDDASGFATMIAEDNADDIDMSNMHFAMNASWHNNRGHVHQITDDITFTQWFVGLIGHIKHQLEYIS